MDFIDQLKQFASRVESIRGSIQTEEATKTSIIMPFFAMMGYDVFNPNEFIPEFIADVGIKKGEKVDFAIQFEGKPTILIEAKSITEKLTKHSSQLFRYFGTTNAKFAILTNGLEYQFFTDLDDKNKMDDKPFLVVNILDIKDTQVSELKKFAKDQFNEDEIFSVASDLKYTNQFKQIFSEELNNPSDELVKYFLSKVYQGVKTQAITDRFRLILKRALNTYISESMSERIKNALETTEEVEIETESNDIKKVERNIITTPEELEAFFIIKGILAEITEMSNISYKDTESYMSVLYNNKVTNWVCRIHFGSDTKKYISIPDENKKAIRYDIQDLYDIKQYKSELKNALQRYI